MATLKKVQRNPMLSAKTQVAPGAGAAAIFGAIADSLASAADYYMPAAMQEMQRRGAEAGQGSAATNRPATGSTASGLSGDPALWADAIASIESAGSGDYSAVGPETRNGSRAYGRYQVMDFNIGPWTEKHVGRRMTTAEFLADPAAQDAVFQGEFGGYVEKYGNPQDAASVWFTGRPLSKGGLSSDGYITGNEYVEKFNAYLTGAAGPGGQPASYSTKVDFQLEGKSRPNKPSQPVIDMLALAAEDTWGPGARVVVTSGKENEGDQAGAPGRHPSGKAADHYVERPDGSVVKLSDADAVTYAQNLRRRGAQSIGAGTEYMGETMFHVDMFGPDERGAGQGSFWGSWAKENAGAIFGIPVGDAPAGGGQAGAVVTDGKGRTQPALYSPYSGPLLLAHNAAAEAAYGAEVLNQAAIDFTSMVNNFALDPRGFEQAARSYVDQVVKDAPATFRAGLREALSSTVTRHQTAIMAELQTETRRRANNSMSAMTERISTEYAELLAAGDAEGAFAKSTELREVLRARENMPGSGWTAAQSENVMAAAMKSADSIRERNDNERVKQAKSALDTIVKAAKNGMSAGDEALLADPWVWERLPSEAAEAQAYITLRDAFPEFYKMPPSAALEMARTVKDAPVQEGWEADVANAAETAAKANLKAWQDDPIKRAGEVLDTKPVPMPEYAPGQEEAFVEWLSGRHEYGLGLLANGYTDKAAFLTADEIKVLSPLLGKDMDPTVRASMAGMIVAGMGEDAVQVFDVLQVDDVTRYAGKLLAIGGNEEAAVLAMRGQAMIAENLVSVPTAKTFSGVMQAELDEALSHIPNSVAVRGDIMAFAEAIYAGQARGLDPDSPEAAKLMQSSLQMALGQGRTPTGEVTGGIQSVLGFHTLLPTGVSGEQVRAAVQMAAGIGGMPHEGGFWSGMANLGAAIMGDAQRPSGVLSETIWREATGVVSGPGWEPMVNGKPIDPNLLGGSSVRLVPVQGNFYRMEVITSGGAIPIMNAAGAVFMFDIKKLVEAAQ